MLKVATVAAWAATLAALFVLLHPGSCTSTGAGLPDGTSLWPPGTRCVGGLPERVTVVLDPTFVLAAAGATAIAIAVLAAARRPRRTIA